MTELPTPTSGRRSSGWDAATRGRYRRGLRQTGRRATAFRQRRPRRVTSEQRAARSLAARAASIPSGGLVGRSECRVDARLDSQPADRWLLDRSDPPPRQRPRVRRRRGGGRGSVRGGGRRTAAHASSFRNARSGASRQGSSPGGSITWSRVGTRCPTPGGDRSPSGRAALESGAGSCSGCSWDAGACAAAAPTWRSCLTRRPRRSLSPRRSGRIGNYFNQELFDGPTSLPPAGRRCAVMWTGRVDRVGSTSLRTSACSTPRGCPSAGS